jgi:carbon-monoxide dehydrogenase large subunit
LAADWNAFEKRRADARKRGRLLGIGIANYVESPVGFPHERVETRVLPDDTVELAVGTQSTGQGHETTFRQVMADQLGVTPEQIRFIGGDSAKIATGGGSHSDRSMRFAGTLMFETGQSIVAKGRRIAAAMLGVGESDVAWEDGFFSAKNSNRRLTVFDVARAAISDQVPVDLRGPLAAEATYSGRIPAHPTGAAVCEVEIDPDTGVVKIMRHTSVDDAGQPINPMILDGQVHGGIAQGAGQALMEQVVYQEGSGEMLTGSFMDYAMPRADMFPFFHVELAEDPTKGNPLRIKGGGESGITPCLAVVMNAVVDALSPYGIEHIDMPATPARVWKAIDEAKR